MTNYLNFLFFAIFAALMALLIHTNDHDYRNAKRPYYECSKQTQKLVPLNPYQYKTLKDSHSIDDYNCVEKQYTRYYVNILKAKRK